MDALNKIVYLQYNVNINKQPVRRTNRKQAVLNKQVKHMSEHLQRLLGENDTNHNMKYCLINHTYNGKQPGTSDLYFKIIYYQIKLKFASFLCVIYV